MNDLSKARFGPRTICCSLIGAVMLIGAGVSSALAAGSPQASSSSSKAANSPVHLPTVGMVALLANPEHYEGAHVRTFGFLHIGRDEDVGLYLHREDYDFQLTKNSFYVALSPEQRNQFRGLSDQYVLLEAVVRSSKGFQADASGTMVSITRVELWNPLHIDQKGR
jgi:hypothetical protein